MAKRSISNARCVGGHLEPRAPRLALTDKESRCTLSEVLIFRGSRVKGGSVGQYVPRRETRPEI